VLGERSLPVQAPSLLLIIGAIGHFQLGKALQNGWPARHRRRSAALRGHHELEAVRKDRLLSLIEEWRPPANASRTPRTSPVHASPACVFSALSA
jgi:hypothetical protein